MRRFVARAAKSDLLGNVFVICGDKRLERERDPRTMRRTDNEGFGYISALTAGRAPVSNLGPSDRVATSSITPQCPELLLYLYSNLTNYQFKPKRNNRFVRSDTLENGTTSFKLNMSSRLSGIEDSTGLITSPLSSSAGVFVESLRTRLQHLYSNTAVTAMVGLKHFLVNLYE